MKTGYTVTGFDGKATTPSTHAIRFTLTIDRQRLDDVPFLIFNLGRHDVIQGRMWFAKHGVLLDCQHCRLVWPDQLLLQDEVSAGDLLTTKLQSLFADKKNQPRDGWPQYRVAYFWGWTAVFFASGSDRSRFMNNVTTTRLANI